MIIYPAIDIKNGKCVRLYQGDYDRETIYDDNPLSVINNFISSGTSYLHIVDLDGAANPLNRQESLLNKLICNSGAYIQIGGGIRTKEQISDLLNKGVSRIIIGSLAVTRSTEVSDWLTYFGPEKLCIAFDIRYSDSLKPVVATNGWLRTSNLLLFDALDYYSVKKLKHILCTNVSLDGTLNGPDFALYQSIVDKFPDLHVQASGGIRSLSDIQQLRQQKLHGVIIGRAIYEKEGKLVGGINMLAKRIIPCLDVKAGKVVKGVQFNEHRVMGDIISYAEYYRDTGADELVFYDITASCNNGIVDKEWVSNVARVLDIPFCVAGGIRSTDEAKNILYAGADKISINSPALENPYLITQLVEEFGTQCVVVGIDSQKINGDYYVYQYTGDVTKSCNTLRKTVDWVKEVQQLGAGEIVLNCMQHDGMKNGYDIEQLLFLRPFIKVPLIASGGAGQLKDFCDVFLQANVEGALAASIFHERKIEINALKAKLRSEKIAVRL